MTVPRVWSSLKLPFVVFTILSALAVRAGAAEYSIVNLGTLGGNDSQAFGINANGQVVGSSSPASDNAHPFRYDGVMHDLGTLPGTIGGLASAINAAGLVTGTLATSTNPAVARHVAYQYDGSMHDIGTLGGLDAFARDINDAGKIVGESSIGSGQALPRHAFLCDGSMHDLGTLGGVSSEAISINSFGRVTGNASTAAAPGIPSVTHAFLYDGTMHDLGTLGGHIQLWKWHK